ncbi:MAG: MBL fold metallo-hydrolase [Selenomonadaceae bacterium]|nr:MBL fold metallo-hydrolase [Selenomonadaceae bacterium]
MNDFALEVLNAERGRTHLFSVGQAGYVIKSFSGQIMGVDLYLSDCVERFEGHVGFKRLLPKILSPSDIEFDLIVCTHAHLDHFDVDSVPMMLANGRTRLLCSLECRGLIDRLGLWYHEEQICFVAPGDCVEFGDFRLRFVDCDHGESAPDAVGVIVFVDGKSIYEVGDTCLRTDRLNNIPDDLDVLIAPINGAFGNMNEAECVELAELLRPGITIPCHYGMFAAHHGDVGKFYELVRDKGLPFCIMRQGERFTLTNGR